jgi:hypothetical protein
VLQKLSERSGKSMAEVLRTGLALHGIATEETSKGRSLAIVNASNQIIKEILIP